MISRMHIPIICLHMYIYLYVYPCIYTSHRLKYYYDRDVYRSKSPRSPARSQVQRYGRKAFLGEPLWGLTKGGEHMTNDAS